MIDRLVVLRANAAALTETRRAIAADPAWRRRLLAALHDSLAECALLATCERIDLIGVTKDITTAGDVALPAPFAQAMCLRGRAAAAHVLRVAAGLESRITGETHILGQLAATAREAADAATSGPLLQTVFERAARTGRRVRAETDLGRLAGSYVSAAADLVVAHLRDVSSAQRVGIVGSGALAADLVDAFAARGFVRTVVFARHVDRARTALGSRRAHAVPLADLSEDVAELNALVTATSSPRTIVSAQDLLRATRLSIVVDLGAPANVDESVAHVHGVRLVRLAELSGPSHAQATIAAADAIVGAELERLTLHWSSRSVVLAAHGAHDDSAANRRVRELAACLAAQRPNLSVVAAFKLGTPGFAEAMNGTTAPDITVIPVMTSNGYFVREVLPSALRASPRFGQCAVTVTPPVGAVRRLVRRAQERVVEAVTRAGRDVQVVVVGHGTSRSQSSADATHALARDIAGSLPGISVAAAFLDQPPLLEAVALAARRGLLVVLPFLLGGGDHEKVDLRERSRRSRGETLILPALGEGDDIVDALTALADWHAPGRTLRIGTRSSPLAMKQTQIAARALNAAGCTTTIVELPTRGDLDQATPIDAFDVDGPFTDDIEQALTEGTIDIAMHSLKDLPLKRGLDTTIAAVLERGAAEEALVTRDGATLPELRRGARIGTSSRRRTAQLLALRPDLVPVALRGAVDARLAAVARGAMDGAILAVAGLERLGATDRIAERFSIEGFVPEAGQGAIALTARVDDMPARAACERIDHTATRRAVELERRIASAIEHRAATRVTPWIAAVHATADDDKPGQLRVRVRAIHRGSGEIRAAMVRGTGTAELAQRAIAMVLPECAEAASLTAESIA